MGNIVQPMRAAFRPLKNLHTLRMYESIWRAFLAWCATNGHEALPANSQTVAAYLESLKKLNRAKKTIELHRSAIGYRHELNGLTNPTKSEPFRNALIDLGLIKQRPHHKHPS